MKNNDQPKIGAPKKDQTKTKISITLAPEIVAQANALKAPGESFSAAVGRAIAALNKAESRPVRPLRVNRRTIKPKKENTDRG